MGQSEVLEFFESHKTGWYDANLIATTLKVSSKSVRESLKQLRRFNLVEYKLDKPPKKPSVIIYHYKIQ